MPYLKTSEIARAVKVHPNTVRLYEAMGLLPPVPRAGNGYRLFTEAHLEQMRLARTALRNACIEGNIRGKAVSVVKAAAGGNIKQALGEAREYLAHIKTERSRAEEALSILKRWNGRAWQGKSGGALLRRRAAARLLDVSVDALRNWERNGLLIAPRNPENGYRMYGPGEISRAKIVRTLRKANYSLMSILRMMQAVENGGREDVYKIVGTSQPDEDLVYATDRWILSLTQTEKDAFKLIAKIERMIRRGSSFTKHKREANPN